MSNKEIITLQIGHYASYVGTHWWNIQESSFIYDPHILTKFPKEVNHDVLFREGKTTLGHTTFTPRLVLVDLNGSLGSLRREGTLYGHASEDDVHWLGDVTLHKSDPVKKNKFLRDLEEEEEDNTSDETENDNGIKHRDDLDKPDPQTKIDKAITDCEELSLEGKDREEVRDRDTTEDQGHDLYDLDNEVNVWSDFLRTGLHPRTTHMVHQYTHHDSQNQFNIFNQGEQVAKCDSEWSSIEDKIRYFTEECDHLQGFHMLCDGHGGFGGLASSTLTYLYDEYRSKARLTFNLTPATPPDQTAVQRSTRLLSSALSLHHLTESSSLVVPLSLASSLCKKVGPPLTFDLLNYKPSLDYHTSAILAAALDTASLPYRKWEGGANMADITESFSTLGRKVSALSLSLPLPIPPATSFSQALINLGQREPWTCLTPEVKCQKTPLYHSCVVRGGVQYPNSCPTPRGSAPHPLTGCSSVDDVLKLYLEETYPGAYNAGCSMRDPLLTCAPFPNVFTPAVSQYGHMTTSHRPAGHGVERVPAMTSLQATPDVFPHIETLTQTVSKFNLHKHTHFTDAGLEGEDLDDTVQALESLAGCYV